MPAKIDCKINNIVGRDKIHHHTIVIYLYIPGGLNELCMLILLIVHWNSPDKQHATIEKTQVSMIHAFVCCGRNTMKRKPCLRNIMQWIFKGNSV